MRRYGDQIWDLWGEDAELGESDERLTERRGLVARLCGVALYLVRIQAEYKGEFGVGEGEGVQTGLFVWRVHEDGFVGEWWWEMIRESGGSLGSGRSG